MNTHANSTTDAPLDDVMMAMDVVDTIRRSTRIVERELDADGRDDHLLARLRSIYETQGIEVPDHILQEGVDALREDRFKYEPSPPSFARTLATIYVQRAEWGRPLFFILLSIVVCMGAYLTFIALPKANQVKRDALAISQTLPAEFERLYMRVDALTDDEAIENRAAQIRSDGFAALSTKDLTLARKDLKRLEDMSAALAQSYDLRIVSGRNNTTGVYRIPDDNPNARNYYIIVEPIDRAGKPVSVDVVNEENNTSQSVRRYGLRVTQETYDAISRDKSDDGIIQNNILGSKVRGALDLQYNMPVLNGVITEW